MQMKSWFIISVPMCLCACVCGYVLLGLFNAFYSFRCFHRFASDGHKERSEKCVEEYLSRLDSMLGTKYAPGQSIMMDSPSVPTLCNALTAHEHPDVLEWGSGGTTTFFSQFSSSWHSIEHEKEWADQARTLIHLTILKHIYFPRHAQQEIWSTLTGTNRLSLPFFWSFLCLQVLGDLQGLGLLSPVGPVVLDHVPPDIPWKSDRPDDGSMKEFATYCAAPRSIDAERTYNVILIDGRARVACAVAVLRDELLRDETGLVMVHDFERSEYHVLLRWYKILIWERTAPRHLVVMTPLPADLRQPLPGDWVLLKGERRGLGRSKRTSKGT